MSVVCRNLATMKLFIAIVSLNFLVAPISSLASGETTRFTNPKTVKNHYAKSIVTTTDLDSDTNEYLHVHDKGRKPGHLELDLDGNGIDDVAILTKGSDPDEAILRIFMCKASCTQVVNELVGSSDSTFLRPLNHGSQIKATEALPSQGQVLKLKNGGVAVTNYGKGQQVYYWNEKKRSMDSIATAD